MTFLILWKLMEQDPHKFLLHSTAIQSITSHLRNVILRLIIVLDVINRKTHWLNTTESRNRIYVELKACVSLGCSDNACTKMQSSCAVQRDLRIHRKKSSKWKVKWKIKGDKHFTHLFVTAMSLNCYLMMKITPTVIGQNYSPYNYSPLDEKDLA